MGARSNRKGKRGEVQVVNLLLPLFPDAVSTRSQQANGARQKKQRTPDIAGVPFRIEVRRRARPNVREALRDAQQYRGDGAPVAFTRADRDDWIVSMRAVDWLALNALAEEGKRALRPTATERALMRDWRGED